MLEPVTHYGPMDFKDGDRTKCGIPLWPTGKVKRRRWSEAWHLVTCHRCRPDLKRLQDMKPLTEEERKLWR